MNRQFVHAAAAMCVGLAGASAGWAVSIVPVGVLSEQVPFSDLRALSADGEYAVGGSRDADGIVTPYLWTHSGSIQALPNPSGSDSWATGVDVRSAVNEIAVAGQIGGMGYRYNAPLAEDAVSSGVWSKLAGAPRVSEYNALATISNGDRYYIAGYLLGSCASKDRGYRYRGSTTQDDWWSNASKWSTRLTSVAANGTACGFNSSGTAGGAPLWTTPPVDYAVIPSETPWQDGVASGISPNGMWLTGAFRADGLIRPFKWGVGDTAVVPLAPLAGDVSAYGMDCSDFGVVAGASIGRDLEQRAVVWDSSGLWGHADAPIVIEAWLADAGVDLGEWICLTGANSISRDGRTVAGEGIWAADGSMRAWVVTIPEPASLILVLATMGWAGRSVRNGLVPCGSERG